jgi:hypothetical protein
MGMHGGIADQSKGIPMGKTSVVKVGEKKCKPFLLEVMVFSPESGYKFEVLVERACTAENDSIWKIVFDLYKHEDEEFLQIIHVSFRAGTPEENEGIRLMARDGISKPQSDLLVNDVFPAARELEGVEEPTPTQKRNIRTALSKVATATVVEV